MQTLRHDTDYEDVSPRLTRSLIVDEPAKFDMN